MGIGFQIKHHFFNAFREIFVHHHGSLDFRAKIFALVIAADPNNKDESYAIVKDIGMKIYENDEDRANLLLLSTKELIKKVHDNNGLYIDTLVANIQQALKIVPRYAKKIDVDSLKPLVELSSDLDILSYQGNILEFLQTLKDDTLKRSNHKDEQE